MKIICIEQAFLYEVKRIIPQDWNLSVSWRNGQNGLQSAVRRCDNVQQAHFYNQQSREEHVSLKSIYLSEQSNLLIYK